MNHEIRQYDDMMRWKSLWDIRMMSTGGLDDMPIWWSYYDMLSENIWCVWYNSMLFLKDWTLKFIEKWSNGTNSSLTENSEKWGVDMFRISELTDKKTLTCVTYTIFQERDLIKTFKIPAKVFLNILRTIEDHFLQVNTLNTMLNSSDCLFQLPRFA